jgi:ribosome-associated toxin RatA of RatAB toxin-antitoxin module
MSMVRSIHSTLALAGCAALIGGSIVGCAGTERHDTWPRHQARADSDTVVPAATPGPVTGRAGKQIEPTRESVPLADGKLVRGRSTLVVHAPIAKVRATVLDFDHYAEFMPHYAASRLLGRRADRSREVYMQITALHGAVKMWARIEMPKPVVDDDGRESHASRFIDGNVDDFQAIWRLKPLDERRTELTLEVFLDPKVPLPSSMLNEENVDGAVKGVTAMRDRIEG